MSTFQKTVLAAHIRDTTKSAGLDRPGTITAKKRGDWIWWVASAALIAGVVYTLYNPHILLNLFA